MTAFHRSRVSALALVAALGAGHAARADVTAQQVWDDYRAQMDAYGEDGVTIGSEALDGGVLTVTDLAIETTDAQGGTFSGTIASLVLTENGDGTVTITTSDEVPFTITTPADPAMMTEESVVALALRQTDATTLVSGDPGALTYDTTAARLAIELDSITEGGAALPIEASVAFNDVTSTSTTTTGEMRDSAFDMTAASLDIAVDASNPDDGSAFNVTGTIADIALQGTALVPVGGTPETMMADGLALDAGYTYGAADYAFEVSDATGPTTGTATVAGGGLDVAVSAEAIEYASTSTGVAVDVTSAMMPFPISATLAEYGANVLIPASAGDAPSDWAFGVNLTDLVLNEEVWALFDPQGTLPRDPATVLASLSGTATLFYDIMDPAQQEANVGAAPGEVNSISIDDLNVSVAGAQITGTGAFTLDNTDLTTFAGIPRPEGAADFQINGVNGLIEKLVAIGLIPAEQVGGAQMMLGLLAVPVGDDQLESRIEVTPEGALLANGQRLQ